MSKLAIVIPYYKIKYFEETLKSVSSQNNKNFVLYIGNDASDVNPLPLIHKYLKKDDYRYINFPDNIGRKNLALHWERILKNVQEDWFQILGDDDIISENLVQAFYENLDHLEKFHCNVIKFSQRWINENGLTINEFSNYENKFINPAENLESKIIYQKRSSLSEHIFKKSSYERFGFQQFPLAWTTDDLGVFQISDGKPIYFIKKAKVFVRVSTENISGKKDNIAEKREAQIQFEKYLINNHYRKLTTKTLDKLVENQISYKYHFGIALGFSLSKIYFHQKKYKKILALPKTYLILNKVLK